MRRGPSVWLFVSLTMLVSVVIPRARMAGQATCDIELGDGTPPLEVAINETPRHCGFLQFSWRAFLAMNWPALPTDPANTTKQARGLPDHSKKIGQNDADPIVWEQYQPNWHVFWPNNPPPAAQ